MLISHRKEVQTALSLDKADVRGLVNLTERGGGDFTTYNISRVMSVRLCLQAANLGIA